MAIKFLDSKRISTSPEPISKSGCLAYYNFEQTGSTLTNQATSVNGYSEGVGSNADGTNTGVGGYTGATTGATGKVNNCWDFGRGSNTAGDYVSGINLNLNGASSISLWINIVLADYGEFIGRANATNLLSYADGHIYYQGVSTSAGVLSSNTWHHVVGTTDSSNNCKIYVDNVLVKTGTGDTVSNSTVEYYIGARATSQNYHPDGKIDELSIWSRELTTSDISMLYNSGDGSTIDNTSGEQSKPTNVQDNSILVEKDTGKRYWFDDSFNKTELKAYWKFNETSGDITNQATSIGSTDSLGTGADLQVTGATYNNTNTPFNTMNFDGTNDVAKAGTSTSQFNFMHNGGKFTVSVWVSIDNITDEGYIISDITGSNTNGFGFFQTGDSKFLFRIFDSGIWVDRNMGLHGMTAGTFYFLTFTWDPTESTNKATFYKNGVEITTANQSTSQGSSSNSNSVTGVGAQGSNAGWLDCKIAEMSVWNRVLTDAEITELYNSGTGKTLDTAKGATWTMNPTFEDDFDGTYSWTDTDTAIGVTSNEMKYVASGGEDYIHSRYDLGSTVSDTAWVLRFTVQTAQPTANPFTFVGLSSNTSELNASQDFLGYSNVYNDNDWGIVYADGSTVPISTNTVSSGSDKYYVEIKRESATQATLNIWTSSYGGTLVESQTRTDIPSTVVDLQYIKFGAKDMYSQTVVWDDLQFYNGVTSIN